MAWNLRTQIQIAVTSLAMASAGCATDSPRTAATNAPSGIPSPGAFIAESRFGSRASEDAEDHYVASYRPHFQGDYGWKSWNADAGDNVQQAVPSLPTVDRLRGGASTAERTFAVDRPGHRRPEGVAYADFDERPERPGAVVRRASSKGADLHEGTAFASRAAFQETVSPAPNGPRQSKNTSGGAVDARPGHGDVPPGYIVNLDGVLSLAGRENPNVALARERINEAYARLERAEVLWLPSIRAGINYNHHEGIVQDAQGNIIDISRSSLYGGLGANAVGAGSPAVPGLAAQFHLTDAIFQPKIASHQTASRQFAATATRNDVLRNTAVAYLELLRAEQALAIAHETLENTQELADLTANYAQTGQGLKSDDERVQAELALRRNDVVRATEVVRVASARLAQLLHADPSIPISTAEPVVAPLDILTDDAGPAEFVATGLSRRPELFEQHHLVCEAVERLRREKYAPLLPSLLLGMSYGGMGGGSGSTISDSSDRFDADAVAFWEVRNLGFGEQAARHETSSLVRQARMRELVLLDQVAREIVEAHTQVTQRRARIAIAEDGVAAAQRSYTLNEQRIRAAQGLPIEVLQSVQALAAARRSYLDAVIDYNIAQFDLCRATGWFLE